MIGNKKIICVIPARLQSTRFPRKILALLAGKPLLQRTWEAASRVPFFDEVVIGVDAQETADLAESFGANWVMTSVHCLNGTDRLIEIQGKNLFQGDIWVNWQADEPFLSKQAISDLLNTCEESVADVWTLKTPLEEDRALDPNLCKVVCDAQGFAMYFSRSPIPHTRDLNKERKFFRHIGLYAYSDEALRKISFMDPCELEEAEMLEQLRFLFHGLKIKVNETQENSVGIDLPEHLSFAQQLFEKTALFPV